MKAKVLFFTLSLVAVSVLAQSNGERNGPGRGLPRMDPATKAAFEACATENGMPKPGSGTRPSQEQHKKMKACLSAKGIAMPEPPTLGGDGARPLPKRKASPRTVQ